MSEFHYVRTLGADGGVDAVEGPPTGRLLSTILESGLPPFRVVLEIVAALCEILDIADEDGQVHGAIDPTVVYMDAQGAVSVRGYGVLRENGSVPEGGPVGPSTDLFGLGRVAYRLFTSQPLELPEEGGEIHEDAMIDAIVGIDFGDLSDDIVADIQWYLAKLLGHLPEERPTAVDVWRTFVAFADEVTGPRLDEWAGDAVQGSGERRVEHEGEVPEPVSGGPEEALAGPTRMKGPVARGAIDFSGGSSHRAGGATAFWTKDEMKAALSSEKEDYRPAPGGGASTSFWTREQLEAMRSGREDAPRPRRAGREEDSGAAFEEVSEVISEGRSESVPEVRSPASTPGGVSDPDPGIVGGATPVPPSRESEETPPPVAVIAPPPPVVSGLVVSGPVADPEPSTFDVSSGVAAEEAGGSRKMVWALALVGVLGMGCAGLLGLGGVGYWWMTRETGETSAVDLSEVDDAVELHEEGPSAEEFEEEPSVEPELPEEETLPEPDSPEPVAAPKQVVPRPRPRPGPAPAPKPAPGTLVRPSSTPAPAPVPVPVEMVEVTFKVRGRGTITCSDGQRAQVDSTRSLKFASHAMPVSCKVEVDDDKWAGLVEGAGTWRCRGRGSSFGCKAQ